MKLTEAQLADLERLAGEYRNHIAKIRIDYPEASDARRQELHELYLKIAAGRATLSREGE